MFSGRLVVHTGGIHGFADDASLEASQDRNVLATQARAGRSASPGRQALEKRSLGTRDLAEAKVRLAQAMTEVDAR